jgi:hypothetical protein
LSPLLAANIGGGHYNLFNDAFSMRGRLPGRRPVEIAPLAGTSPSSTITLTATGATSATHAGAAGTVTNVSPGTDAGAGEWLVTLTTPLLFTNLVLQPGDGGTSAAQGDFAFVSLTVGGVPEVSTWAMMILGFFGVGLMAYRRKAARPIFRLV